MPFYLVERNLQLWQPFFSAEQTHLCTFERGLQEEHFCENIWNLDLWLRRSSRLNEYLSSALADLNHLSSFAQQNKSIHRHPTLGATINNDSTAAEQPP